MADFGGISLGCVDAGSEVTVSCGRSGSTGVVALLDPDAMGVDVSAEKLDDELSDAETLGLGPKSITKRACIDSTPLTVGGTDESLCGLSIRQTPGSRIQGRPGHRTRPDEAIHPLTRTGVGNQSIELGGGLHTDGALPFLSQIL